MLSISPFHLSTKWAMNHLFRYFWNDSRLSKQKAPVLSLSLLSPFWTFPSPLALCSVNIPNPWIQDHWFLQALLQNPIRLAELSLDQYGVSVSPKPIMRKPRLNLKLSMTGRISVQPETPHTSKMSAGFQLGGGFGGGFSRMTYISPKPLATQGLRTWAMSNNVSASRNGTGAQGRLRQH